MGLRFYRRFKIFRGRRQHLRRSGVSTSIGGRGHWTIVHKTHREAANRQHAQWMKLLLLIALIELLVHFLRNLGVPP